MSNDVLITPASRKIEFKDSSANVDAKIETDASGNLIITNTGGDISIGDTTSDIFVGDGTANVDIVFEQSGEIRGETGVTVTLGQSDSSIRMGTDLNLNSNDITNAGTINAANLNISGTTTTISSTNTTITDSIIELNSGLTVANSKDIGFVFERGSTGNNAAFIWDESADRFTVITTTGTASDDTLSGTAANFQAGSFYGNGANLTSLNGTNISSGTVAAARIANLDASKITSGTIGGARLATGTSGDWWSGNAVIVRTDGVSEVGKYIDFHNADAGTSDYTARITNTGDHLYATGRVYVNDNQRVFADDYHPNADTWTTARTITLGGDLTGNVSINGSANVTLTAAVVDDSHFHHRLDSTDDRDMKPSTSGIATSVQAIKPFFSSYGGMTGSANTTYLDVLALDTYSDSSGGGPSAITFRKGTASGNPIMEIWHAGWNATTWGAGQRVYADNYHPNADTWTTARTLSLTGAVTGSVSWDGSGNASIATTATADPTLTLSGDASGSATFTNLGNATLSVTVNDDSHNHVISNVDGLQTALDGKAPTASPTFTGDLTIPNKIIHSGDSNTYIQFHAADQFRVVAGGSEVTEWRSDRMQMNNKSITFPAWTNFAETALSGIGYSALNAPIHISSTGVGSTDKYLPFLQGSATHDQGYRTSYVLGGFKQATTGSGWGDGQSGFFMAMGGSDAAPTKEFRFTWDGRIWYTDAGSSTYLDFDTSNTLKFVTGGSQRLSLTNAGAAVTGNITVTGTVDGVDIAARDGILTSTTTTAGAALPKAGGTMTGTITGRDFKPQAGYHFQRSDHHSGHLEGSYNNIGANGTKSNPIYTIGSSYNPASTTLSNMYGIGFCSTSSSFANPQTGSYNWGMYVAADGDARVWLDGSTGTIWSVDQHYVGANVVWNAGNDGSGSGLDADLLDGLNVHNTQGTQNSANTILRTQANGYAMLGWINTTSGVATGTPTRIYCSQDSYIRYYTPASLAPYILNQGSTKNAHVHSEYLGTTDTAANSQLLDSIDSTGFMRTGRTLTTIDTISNGGDRYDPSTNNPTNAHYAVLTYGNGGNVTGQLATHFVSGNLYSRGYNSSWSAWRTYWNSLNDGSGSGLDADLLDGQHGSYYLNYNNFSNIPTNRVLKDSLTANSTSSITTFTSAAAINTAAGGQSALQVYNPTSGNDAFMTFHIGGDYAIYLGLDGGTNKLSTGGWSDGANSYEIYHAGNKPSLATLGFTGASNANYITNNNQLTNGASYLTTSGKAADSNLLDGLDLHTGRNNEVNKVVRTDGNGYIQAGWINTISGSTTTAMDRIYASNDGYIRYYTPANFLNSGGFGDKLFNNQGETHSSSTNFNTSMPAGVHYMQQGTNGPTGTTSHQFYGVKFGLGSDHSSSSSYSSQMYYPRAGQGGGNGLYFRDMEGGSWGSWRQVDAGTLGTLSLKSSSGPTGANQVIRSHSNNYIYHRSWIDVGGDGLFSTTTNGAHFRPNNVTSYGTWSSSGSKGGYDGIVFDHGGDTALMFDSGGNGGMYRQSGVGWYTYFHNGNDCLGVADSTTSSSYSLYVTGAIYATGDVTAFSDRRVKENIITIDTALEKVNKLRGVYYNRIDNEDKEREIGFIAQEVNEVAPELVTYAEDVDQYGVKYGNTTALLVEAVKELTQQVKDLKQEIEEIKNVK